MIQAGSCGTRCSESAMRWIASVGSLALIGLVVGLGLGGLIRVQAYLNHQAELHFEAQQGLPAGKPSVADRWLPSQHNEGAELAAGEIDRPAAPQAPGGATAIPESTGSTERNMPAAIEANEASRTTELARPHQPVTPRTILGEGQFTRRSGVSDLAETESAQHQNDERFVRIQVNRFGTHPSVYVVPRE
jgi:hypothetical protein